jgi:hypothetical protein
MEVWTRQFFWKIENQQSMPEEPQPEGADHPGRVVGLQLRERIAEALLDGERIHDHRKVTNATAEHQLVGRCVAVRAEYCRHQLTEGHFVPSWPSSARVELEVMGARHTINTDRDQQSTPWLEAATEFDARSNGMEASDLPQRTPRERSC